MKEQRSSTPFATAETGPESGYPPISGYGIIGDCRSAALVSSSGSIDWCCWPNFDGPSLFGRLLDWEKGGHFSLQPTDGFRSHRRYVEATSVLETTFETATGAVTVTDLMPALTESQKRERLMPFRAILRRVEGVRGQVEMGLEFSPRPAYGRQVADLQSRGGNGLFCHAGRDLYHLRSDLTLRPAGQDARLRFTVGSGERRYFSLAYSQDGPSVYPSIGEEADREIDMSLDYWRNWSSQFRYSGPYGDILLRSALVLKLMSFAPSGAIVAAPTTSLPEAMEGGMNWDYRYCWLRDAAFTVRDLYYLGFHAEGDAFVQWLAHATRLTHPELQVMYDVYGESRLPEHRLDHLEGYRGTQPVLIGNEAHSQFQLDVYGELLEAIHAYYRETSVLDGDTRSLIKGAAEVVVNRWHEPDHGIWEFRSRSQHVHGKASAWQALDYACKLAQEAGFKADSDRWERVKEEIRRTVMSKGFNPRIDSFTQTYYDKRVDASLLTLPLIGFIAADDSRMRSTAEAIRRKLAVADLVYRHSPRHGSKSKEGAFLACSFWLVSNLALGGKLDEAYRLFERLLSRSNDLGLYPEEIDPESGAFRGNFPQALTHVALIDAARNLERAERR